MPVSVPSPDFTTIIKETGPVTAAGIKLLWNALSALTFGTGTVQGPLVSGVGDVALWANTTGTLLKDAAFAAASLTDYATGSWTPTDASGGGLSFTVGGCTYVKIGRLFVVQGNFTYPNTADVHTNKISGLPATANNNTPGTLFLENGFADGAVPFVLGGQSAFEIFDTKTGAPPTNAGLSTQLVSVALVYLT